MLPNGHYGGGWGKAEQLQEVCQCQKQQLKSLKKEARLSFKQILWSWQCQSVHSFTKLQVWFCTNLTDSLFSIILNIDNFLHNINFNKSPTIIFVLVFFVRFWNILSVLLFYLFCRIYFVFVIIDPFWHNLQFILYSDL